MAKPVDGGIVVNGKWGFISGAHHAQWQEIIAILVPPDGEPYPVMALVPMSDLLIVDDWHTSGLRAPAASARWRRTCSSRRSGSCRCRPCCRASRLQAQRRVADLPLAAAAGRLRVLGRHRWSAWRRARRRCSSSGCSDRKITYTAYESQREAPITHLQVAEATMKIDQAEFHAHRLADPGGHQGRRGLGVEARGARQVACRRRRGRPAGQGVRRHLRHRQRRLVDLQRRSRSSGSTGTSRPSTCTR